MFAQVTFPEFGSQVLLRGLTAISGKGIFSSGSKKIRSLGNCAKTGGKLCREQAAFGDLDHLAILLLFDFVGSVYSLPWQNQDMAHAAYKSKWSEKQTEHTEALLRPDDTGGHWPGGKGRGALRPRRVCTESKGLRSWFFFNVGTPHGRSSTGLVRPRRRKKIENAFN